MERSSPQISTTSSIVDDKSNLPNSKRKDVLGCHICWEPPTDPVATSCGHVFCWPCIYQWFRYGPKPCLCPLCRHILRRDFDIIPLYGGGGGGRPSDGSPTETSTAASESIIPPRPSNPWMVRGTASTEGTSAEERPRDAGVDFIALQASARLASSQGFILQSNRVSDLETERADLQRQNNEMATMLRVARLMDLRQIGEEIDARIEMCDQIVSLRRQLDRANSLLPPGWNDGLL